MRRPEIQDQTSTLNKTLKPVSWNADHSIDLDRMSLTSVAIVVVVCTLGASAQSSALGSSAISRGKLSATSFDSSHEAGVTTAYRGSLTRGRTFCETTLRRSAAVLAANVLVASSASSAPLDTAVVRAFISATAASITGASGFIGCTTGEVRRAQNRVECRSYVLCASLEVPERFRLERSVRNRGGDQAGDGKLRRLLSNARRLSRRRLFLPAGGCCAVKAPRATGA